MHNTKRFLVVILAVAAVMASCKNDSPDNNPSTSSIITSGTWKVTFYSDNGNNETSHFSGYNFTFNSNGVVTAANSGTTVTGTWSDGNDDSQSKLILDFSSPADFEEISDDWHVIQKTSAKIELEDVSGGNGGTDLLTFEKN